MADDGGALQAPARLFIALNLPPDVRTALHDAARPLRAAAPLGVAWARVEALHLTLKFLGDVAPAHIAPIADALERVAARHFSIRLRVAGVGAFPTLLRPRVLWAGVEPSPRLELLQHELEAACATLGFEVDGRPFRPHVTLGRVREAAPAVVAALVDAAARCGLAMETMVPTMDLMQSRFEAGGATHVALRRAPLREE